MNRVYSKMLVLALLSTTMALLTPSFTFAQKAVEIRPVAAQVNRENPPRPAPEQLPGIDPSPRLSLTDLESMSIVSNPSIGRAQALVQSARGNWVQVGLAPNPVVGYSGQQIGSRGLAEQDGVVINQDIVRLKKLRLNRHVAEQEIFRAERQLAAQQQRVVTDVRVAYFQVLAAQRLIDTNIELVQIGQRGVQTAQKLFDAKEVGKADVLQAQIEIENAEILLNSNQNRHQSGWQQLSAVVGRPELTAQPLAGDLEVSMAKYTFEETLSRLSSSSPEIAIAMANIERARWAYQRALVESSPNIAVQGLVNARDNGIGGRSDGAVQITLPLPIWNRNQGGITQALGEATAAERALNQLELSLQNRLAPVFERYSNARNRVERYQSRVLPAAQEALDLSRQTYEVGETGFGSLLIAQRTYSQTRISYLESLRELRIAEAEMEGMLLAGSLDQP